MEVMLTCILNHYLKIKYAMVAIDSFRILFLKNKISYKICICPKVAENFHEKSLLLYQGVSLYDLTKTNVDDLVLYF